MAERREKGTGSYAYREAEGRWRGVIRHRGQSHVVYVHGPGDERTEAKVKAALRELRRDLDAGRQTSQSRQKLGAYLDSWLEVTVAPHLRPSTYRSYALYCHRYLKPRLGAIPLRELTSQDVQVAINAIKRQVSPRTTSHIRAILRTALQAAMEASPPLIDRNPAVPITVPSIDAPEIHPFTDSEALAFLDEARGHRFAHEFTVLLTCGLRLGEALGLRWEDVDFGDGALARPPRLDVRKSLGRSAGKYILGEPKSKTSKRTLVLPSLAVAALRAQHAAQLARELEMGRERWKKANPWGLVFTRDDGEPINAGVVNHAFHVICAQVGLPRIPLHALRHSAASLLLADGASLKDVADALGHTDIKLVARTYGHVYDEQLARTAARMDRALTPK